MGNGAVGKSSMIQVMLTMVMMVMVMMVVMVMEMLTMVMMVINFDHLMVMVTTMCDHGDFF